MAKLNLGAVTAYADAVAAGFTGTREEFAEWLANAGKNAAAVAANLEESKAVLAGVNTAGEAQVKAVQDEGAAQIGNVGTAGEAAVEDVYAAAEAKKAEILDIGTVLVGEQNLTESQQYRVKSNLDAADGIVETASGERIVLDDASGQHFRRLAVYGKSTQDGTPAPDAPAEIVSVGADGTITVTIEGTEGETVQTLTIAAPDGLRGIPVTSGGNYTDADGQQWICDEVDFVRGVRVQRIVEKTLNGSETWKFSNRDNGNQDYLTSRIGYINTVIQGAVISNRFETAAVTGADRRVVGINVINSASYSEARIVLRPENISGYTEESWKAWIAANPVTILYALAEPLETPLTESELAAYRALHTNCPDTAIYADDNAGVAVDYAADTKRYIDKKFDALAAAIVNN